MKDFREEDANFTILYILQQVPDMRNEEQLRSVASFFKAKKYLSQITELDTIVKICRRAYVESYHKNQVIFYKGQKGDYFYIVLSGLVGGCNEDETQEGDFKQPFLFTLGPDQSFGEMALVSNAHRMCTVKAIENTDLIVIPKEVYMQYYGVR